MLSLVLIALFNEQQGHPVTLIIIALAVIVCIFYLFSPLLQLVCYVYIVIFLYEFIYYYRVYTFRNK